MVFFKHFKEIAIGLMLSLCLYILIGIISINNVDNRQNKLYITSDIEYNTQNNAIYDTYAISHQINEPTNIEKCIGGLNSYSIPAISNPYNNHGLISNVYETLFQNDGNGRYKPMLATRYYVSPDRSVYTFDIRPHVSFQGNPFFKPTRYLNADDVVFSLHKIKQLLNTLPRQSTYKNGYIKDIYDNIRYIYSLNQHQVQIVLYNPMPNLLQHLSNSAMFGISSHEYYQYMQKTNNIDGFYTYPIGTGAWLQENHELSYVYNRNDGYWGRKRLPIRKMIVDIADLNGESNGDRANKGLKPLNILNSCQSNVMMHNNYNYQYRKVYAVDYAAIATRIWYQYIEDYHAPHYEKFNIVTKGNYPEIGCVPPKPLNHKRINFGIENNLTLSYENLTYDEKIKKIFREVVVRRGV